MTCLFHGPAVNLSLFQTLTFWYCLASVYWAHGLLVLFIVLFKLSYLTLVNKGPSSQGYGFSSGHVWMWELDCEESWVLKNWCFWTVVLEKTLERVPWTARRSNQSILKEIILGCSLEGMMLKLKLQYFGHLMWRVNSLEKTHAGRDWGQEEKGMTEDQMAGWHHKLDGSEFEWTLGVGDGQGTWHAAIHGIAKSPTGLRDWTELIMKRTSFLGFFP